MGSKNSINCTLVLEKKKKKKIKKLKGRLANIEEQKEKEEGSRRQNGRLSYPKGKVKIPAKKNRFVVFIEAERNNLSC